jgi:hypothetical protein
LRFQRRAKIEQILGKLRRGAGSIISRMLDDTFANFEGEIQAAEFQVTMLKFLDDANACRL